MAKNDLIPHDDFRAGSGEMRQISVSGTIKFVQFSAEQQARARYPADKPTATVCIDIGDPQAERLVELTEYLHRGVGGEGRVWKDGNDEAKRTGKDYNKGKYVARVRFGQGVSFVDTAKNPIPPAAFEDYDEVMLAVSPYHYEAGAKHGVSLYARWIMLVKKGGTAAEIPDFDRDGGFVYQGQGQEQLQARFAPRETAPFDDEDDDEESYTPERMVPRGGANAGAGAGNGNMSVRDLMAHARAKQA